MSLWVPRITSPSGVIRIQGTAGSGKTQLALQLLSDAVINKQKSLVLSEIDFANMTDIERNKLFVGLTRAQMAVEIVLSPTADECFRKLLE